MIDASAAPVYRRVGRLAVLVERLCRADSEQAARLWARDLERVTQELHQRVAEHIAARWPDEGEPS